MTRHYPHNPDLASLQERAQPKAVKGISIVTRTIARGVADAGTYDAGIDNCVKAAILGWLFEDPKPTIESYLDQGAEWAAHAPDALPPPYSWGSLITWLRVAQLAGHTATVHRLASLALDPAMQEPDIPTAAAGPLLAMSAALALGDTTTARTHADDMRTRTALLGTPPDQNRRVHRLPDITDAIATGDQAALDAAATDRSTTNTRHWRRSLENRRHWFALLDPEASLLLATAPTHGLTPPDIPDVPPALIPGPHRDTA